MATTLKPIIYGKSKSIDFAKFDIGAVLRAIASDCVEDGRNGVQGIKIKDDYKSMFSYEKSAKRTKKPYFQAGVAKNGALYLVLRDEANEAFEALALLVKDYEALKTKLKEGSASVTDVDPESDDIIKRSVANTGKKLGVTPDDDPDFGEITGNIVLIAHGSPAKAPSGRVIGAQLGQMTPDEIVDGLTKVKDPKKRIPKDFNGTLTLCGCFTASGGPEAEKQDDPFAKKVLDLFRKRGYAKISVVGYPGATATEKEDFGKDSKGTITRRGDEKVKVNQFTQREMDKADAYQAEIKKAMEKYNDQVPITNAARETYIQATEDLDNAQSLSGLSQKEFLKTSNGKTLGKALLAATDTLKKEKAILTQLDVKYEKLVKAYEKTGLGGTIAEIKGRFGLRTVN